MGCTCKNVNEIKYSGIKNNIESSWTGKVGWHPNKWQGMVVAFRGLKNVPVIFHQSHISPISTCILSTWNIINEELYKNSFWKHLVFILRVQILCLIQRIPKWNLLDKKS